jgi:alcohol dehydrogenase (NADP+)
MTHTNAYAAYNATSALAPYAFERRTPKECDVQIEILYCGVCHSDLHTARNEWKGSTFPVVPGHEIVGRVTQVGERVKNFRVGDFAAVGCMVDSCRTCSSCKENLEQYCEKETIYTYNSPDKHSGKMTYGGYSERIVVDESFVLRIPQEFKEKDLPRVAPLLCAGITTYSPLSHWNTKKGSKVAVVGLGGLGHMAIKIAAAMGAEVTLFTTSPNKIEDAKQMGAHHVVVSKQKEEVKKYNNSFDLIINTVSVPHDLDMYVDLLKRDGTMCLVGLPSALHPSPNVSKLILKRKAIAGSLIGGIKETQEMLDFCAKHNILCDIELIPIQKINEAYERMLKSDVKYRFVIDIASITT